jgi:RNA polymerase primary sigma factor
MPCGGSVNPFCKTFSELEQKFQREPSAEEMADELQVSLEEVRSTMQSGGRHISVDAPFVQGESNNLLDVLTNDTEETPDSNLMRDSLKREVSRALATLPERESEIISDYFGLNGNHSLTLEDWREV